MTADFRGVRRILWQDWDPIGCGVPEDEYDGYVPGVVRLLQDGARRAAVESHLRELATETLACEVDEARLASAVDKLMALGVARENGEPP